MNKHFHLWEKAALCALCLTLLLACRVQGERDALAHSIVRVHVIAASDAPEEQAQKLLVRDAVLACLAPLLEGADSRAEAEERLFGALEELARTACERGCGRLAWSCLDWNRPSIDFYLGLGAEPMDEWTTYRVAGERLLALAEETE